jgi:hypothetical protein
LTVTPTAPGFWVIEPDNVTGEPRLVVLGLTSSEIVVDGLVNVVRVVEVAMLVDVCVQTVTVVDVVVIAVDVEVGFVVVRNVDVLEVVVMVEVVEVTASILVLVVCVVLVE